MTGRDRADEPRGGHDEEQDEARGGQKKRGRPPLTGHPPIIIKDEAEGLAAPGPGGEPSAPDFTRQDVLLEFDSRSGAAHYGRVSDHRYETDELAGITFVKVRTEQGEHICLISSTDPPELFRYRVEVTERRRDGSGGARITVDATGDEGIVIELPPGYADHTTGTRKMRRGPLRKIKSLKIYGPDGVLVHDCPEVRPSVDCQIIICDQCVERPGHDHDH